MKYFLKYMVVIFTIGFVFVSCCKKDLSDDQYIAFAQQIEQDLNQGNDSLLKNSFDTNTFKERILAGVDENEQKNPKLDKILQNPPIYFSKISNSIENGADFRFLRFYRDAEKKPHAIFQTYGSDGSIALEDWYLKAEKGQVKICDIFDLISGIFWSDESRYQICSSLGLFTDNFLKNNNLINAGLLISEAKYKKADSILQPILKKEPNNLYARTIELNLMSNSKTYEQTHALAEQFIKDFPAQKRTATFYLLQSSIRHGLVDESIEHINTLRELLGETPLWNTYLAFSYQSANEFDYALQYLDSAIAQMPNYSLYMSKLDVAYSAENYAKCMEAIMQSDALYSTDNADIIRYKQAYPKLSQSIDFQQWETTLTNKDVADINN
ncbi:MAG: hypothetical protein LBR36_02455 [Bacteroidales bacterium]|jgi:hypothetical protein|nr:hypothetical protein [Bacteroidales bacterium]